ncbi:hypothetical protein QUF99_15070 [Bacillus sp. DX4.1]|uniref:hypothetical protein n=1 Tax=Bacillus sp. DX4.1 TaxID=3055867 RepID=UPI0025A0BCD4|nr:hypothetical protein [Bacillus sp. DX4.1]MDM5188589.1 hypothetical protein [Bacillus sp. DX4.1]
MRYSPSVIQMQGLPVKLQSAITNEFIDEPITAFNVRKSHSIYTAVIETKNWRNTIEFDGRANEVKQRDIEPLGKCVDFYIVFTKLDDFFGLGSVSDRRWFFGTFVIGFTLFLINMFIAFVL